MNKKGISSVILVGLILAVLAFALAVITLYKISNDTSLANRDLCKISVLSRATVPAIGQPLVPLNCKPERICLTTDGKNNDCKQFAGYDDVRKVELKVSDSSVNNLKAVDTIQREVANAMYDCWVMTGQGKLDIFPPGSGDGIAWNIVQGIGEDLGLTQREVNPRCIICSRVALSDALIEADKKYLFLKDVDVNRFLTTQNIPGTSQTYASVLISGSGTGYNAVAPDELISAYLGKTSLTDEEYNDFKALIAKSDFRKNNLTFYDNVISSKEEAEKYLSTFQKSGRTNDLAIIFAQIKIKDLPEEEGWSLSTVIKASLGVVVSTGLGFNSADSTRLENQAISAETCGQFQSTMPGEQKGCSLVKLTNWDIKEVNNLCAGGIEGNL